MKDRLAIRSGLEAMPMRLEIVPQLAVVVDFAVRNQPQRAVLVDERLMTAAHVDDRKAPHAECERSLDMCSFIVGSTVDRQPSHRADGFGTHCESVERENSVNAAHRVKSTLR